MMIPDAFWAFLNDDSQASLAALHTQIRSDPWFTERAPWYPRAVQLLRADRFDEVIDLVEDMMPALFLCPEAHQMAAHALRRIGEDTRADAHAAWAQIGIEAIKSTGRGTADRPWRVLRILDEYALLRERDIHPQAQRQVWIDDRCCDVHVDGHGAEYWFEVLGR